MNHICVRSRRCTFRISEARDRKAQSLTYILGFCFCWFLQAFCEASMTSTYSNLGVVCRRGAESPRAAPRAAGPRAPRGQDSLAHLRSLARSLGEDLRSRALLLYVLSLMCTEIRCVFKFRWCHPCALIAKAPACPAGCSRFPINYPPYKQFSET